MTIRTEQQADYDSVYQVVKNAFKTAEQSDGNEQNLVNVLRQSSAFIPELSLVAEIKRKDCRTYFVYQASNRRAYCFGTGSAVCTAPISKKGYWHFSDTRGT